MDEFLRRRDKLGLRPDPSFGERYGLSVNEPESEELDELNACALVRFGRGRFGELEIVLFSPDIIFCIDFTDTRVIILKKNILENISLI